jgi:hypothetical protein
LVLVNQQVTSFQDQVDVYFSRKNIRKKQLKTINSIWHPDWVQADNEQVFAIWEEDTEGTKTLSGSLNTTITVSQGNTIGGTVGFSSTVKTKDDIIRQLKISRHAYFAGSFVDQGWGFSEQQTFLPPPPTHGWPWYEGNNNSGTNVVWTWPYNVIP